MSLLLALVFAAPARADGYSADIELLRPSFSPGAVAGLDSPTFRRPGSVRVGTLFQYQRDPLVLYQLDREVGAVISNRLMVHLGVSADFTERVSARFVLPVGGQWGSDVPSLAADTGGIGDASIGVRVHLVETGPFSAAARADVMLPFGTPGAYLGETGLRGAAGLVSQVQLGPLALLADAGVLGRNPLVTAEDFELGSEIALSGGLRLDIWPETLSIGGGVLHRTGFANLWAVGGETPTELVADLSVRPIPEWRVNFGVGRGVADGYGTTQIRAFAGVTFERIPPIEPAPAPEPIARLLVTEAPDLPPEPVEVVPDPPLWKPDELARVERDEIIIRDPIQFELGTNRILPESLPTLVAISKLLAEHPEIGHLVIEGHASEEGTFAYNYDLSIRRSLAIFQELILAGTYPARLSCRGMGEVEPVAAGSDEAALAKNRRVIFHIVRRLEAGEDQAIRTQMLLPWDGAPKTFTPPPPIPAPEPKKGPEEEKKRAAPKKDDDFPSDPDLFRERDEDEEAPQ